MKIDLPSVDFLHKRGGIVGLSSYVIIMNYTLQIAMNIAKLIDVIKFTYLANTLEILPVESD